jgi:DNA-binding SARP family transcriptional activator
MQLCIRGRDRVATVAHYRRLEETLGHELGLLPSQEICLLYEMTMRGS